MLHHGLNKRHPYVDGNKRLALAAMLTFLYINRFECVAFDTEFFAPGVANDLFTLNDSARFVRTRAFRLTWDEERLVRWAASHSASDRIAVYALLEEEWFTATRLPEAFRKQIESL